MNEEQEIQHEDENTQENEFPQGQSKRGRGPTKGVQSKIPMVLEFDAYDMPVGKWSGEYGKHVGRCSHKIDIKITNWNKVPQPQLDNMWEETKRKFHIVDPKGVRKANFLRAVDSRYRTWRSWLIARFVTRTRAPKTGSPNANLKPWELYEGIISEEDWNHFLKHIDSPEFKVKSARGKQSAAANIHRHRLGPRSYVRRRKEWIDKQKLPAPSDSISGESSSIMSERVENRPMEWCLAHMRKTKDGDYEVDPNKPETAAIVKKVMEYWEEERKEKENGASSNDNSDGFDALSKAFGKKDHRGYVKVISRLGVGVGHDKAFGKVDRKKKREMQGGYSLDDLEEVRASVNAEWEKKFEERLQESLKERVAAEVQQYLSLKEPPKMHTDIEPSPSIDPEPLAIEAPKKCRLAVQDDDNLGNLVVVADGTVHPLLQEVVHNLSRLPNHYRVSLDKVYSEHKSVALPIPLNDGAKTIGEAEKGFVQWPVGLVMFEDKVEPSPSKKRKVTSQSREHVSSCGPMSQGSTCAEIDNFIGEEMSQNLGEECELLCYRVVGGDFQTICIPLNQTYCFVDGESEIWVTKEDVSEFLRGAWANISLIHVYIMYLIEDFVSLFDMKHFKFLCPQRIAGTEIDRNVVGVQKYVKDAIMSEVDKGNPMPKFFIAPFIQAGHWVLVVVDISLGWGYVFDPLPLEGPDPRRWLCCMNVFRYAYMYYKSTLKGKALEKMPTRLEYKWMECPQQKGGFECGYYVMKFMYDIVVRHGGCAGDLEQDYVPRTEAYSEDEMKEVREQWAKYFRTRYLVE